MGPELMQKMRDQAEDFGTRFVTDLVSSIEPGGEGEPHTVRVGDDVHRAWTVILAMGAEHKKLGVPGEEEFGGRGVSYCATCDAAFYRGKKVIVVGGGDSAMEEAIFLSKFASTVTIEHRRNEFRASAIMIDRAREIENIEFLTPYLPLRFEEGSDGTLGSVHVRHAETGEERHVETDGLFVAIGHQPTSRIVEGQVPLDEDGYVRTEGRSTRTAVPGVFGAGDLVDRTYRQAITAAGSGCQAALDAEWYLRDTPTSPEAHWTTPDELEAEAEAAANAAGAA
jgi:thioredoxin reductase (NADPH)